jgi:AraC-like DNA-binding protein
METRAFTGKARPRSLWGLVGIDLGCNAHRVERRQRDIRLDGVDHYFALFQIAGRSTIIQNDRTVQLAAGDVALVDSGRPGTYVCEDNCAQWFSLQLPRRSLMSHLGFDLPGGLPMRGGSPAGRILFDLVRDADASDGTTVATPDVYMRLAIYDLIGALFAPCDSVPVSLHSDKLFRRVCDIVKDRFTDPAFGPREVAAEAGISLRYLQKLFTARNSTCTHFIHSIRLDHAAHLLHRRRQLAASQPLSEIAYACGFADYTNFARRFRRRFSHAPGSHSGKAEPGYQRSGRSRESLGL